MSRSYSPGGTLQILPGRYTQSEMDAAVLPQQWGNNVILRPATGQGRVSDLLVNGLPYDVYTPQAGTSMDNVLRAILAKDSQAQGVVLDLRNIGGKGYTEDGILTRLRELGASNINDIVFVKGGR